MALAALPFLQAAGARAYAADPGAECCADLEGRIAELEATTARKGNRKVSLTVTGYITKQIMFWDDGVESNAYITDMGPTQASNFRLLGSAKIAPGWPKSNPKSFVCAITTCTISLACWRWNCRTCFPNYPRWNVLMNKSPISGSPETHIPLFGS
jgi:hypothetical protein